MLDFLIVAVVVILVILLGIKYGLLQVIAITLAILALIPFLISVWLYFLKAPILRYQLVKTKKQEDKAYMYGVGITISCIKGRGLLENVYARTRLDIFSENVIDQVGFFDETGSAETIRLHSQQSPVVSEKHKFIYILHYASPEDLKAIKLTLLADVALDPYRQGVLSIFQSNYRYRFVCDIPMDFENLNTQEGLLERLR
jgi:hypothetical protein